MTTTAEIVAPAPASQSGRIYAFEIIRAVAMLMVIVAHGAMPYLDPPRREWFPDAHYSSPAFGWIVQIAQMLVPPAFFLMSGYLARASYFRNGEAQFIESRKKHLLLPFAVTWPIMVVSCIALWRDFPIVGPDGNVVPQKMVVGFAFIQLYHLWFLVYLMLFVVVVVIWHRVVDPQIAPPTKTSVDRAVQTVCRSPLAIAAGAAITIWPLQRMHGMFVDTAAFWVPQARLLVYYAVFFAAGWILQRRPERLDDIRRWRWASLAVMTTLVITVADLGWPPGEVSLDWVCRPMVAVFVWSALFAVVGFSLEHLNRPNAAISFMAEASYWCYLVHLPLEMWIQKHLRTADIAGPIKFVLVLVLTLAPLLLTYPLIRNSPLGAYLSPHATRARRVTP